MKIPFSHLALVGLFLCVLSTACQPSTEAGEQAEASNNANVETAQTYTKTFPEYGFSITAPCQMEDVSLQSPGDFLVNLGGISDKNDMSKVTAYQFIVSRLPIGYKNIPPNKLARKIDEMLRQMCSKFQNVQPIKVGYEEYPGYVGYTQHQGLRQKGMIFAVNNYIIAMTVMTNNSLETKFNKFSNGFKILK